MSLRRKSFAMIAVVLVYMTSLAVVAYATEQDGVANAGRVPVPAIPKGQGAAVLKTPNSCGATIWSLLEHQRDETVREGIRSTATQPQGMYKLPCGQGTGCGTGYRIQPGTLLPILS